MEFMQPNDAISTDKTEAESRRLTEIRNQTTLMEGELVRLRELIKSEKFTVGELVKEKGELTSQCTSLTAQVATLTIEVESLTLLVTTLEENKKVAEDYINSCAEGALAAEKKSEQIYKDIEKQSAKIEAEKEDLAKRKQSMNEQEALMFEKMAKLRELII